MVQTILTHCLGKKMQETLEHSTPIMWVLATTYILIAVLIIITNICTITTVATSRKLHQPVNYYIASMSAANFLMVFAVVPVMMMMIYGRTITQDVLCNIRIIRQLVGDLVMFQSIYMMVAIALDRYNAVLNPQKPQYTVNRCMAIIAGTWAGAIVYAAPSVALMISRKKEKYKAINETVHEYCYFDLAELTTKYVTDLLVGYIIPLVLTGILYGKVVRQLWRQRMVNVRRMQDFCWKKRSIKMAVGILILFAVCWLPIHMILLATLSYQDILTLSLLVLRHLATILVFCNSWIYVVVYAYYNIDFRLAITSLLYNSFCKTCRRLNDVSGSVISLNSLQGQNTPQLQRNNVCSRETV